MMEWIKCREKKPEIDETVLVYNPHDGISFGEFDPDEVKGYIESDGTYFITNSGWETQYEWAPYMSPTHWMPLPKPPIAKKVNCDKVNHI